MAAPAPPVWPQRRSVPAALHRHRAALAHPALEAGEEAFELAKAARQQIMHVAGLRDSRSKVRGRGIGIALDDRDPVDEVAEHTGSTHARQAAADHNCAGDGHGVPLLYEMHALRRKESSKYAYLKFGHRYPDQGTSYFDD